MKVFHLDGQGDPLGLHQPVGAIGNFDGIHLGHRKVIDKTLASAEELGGASVVVSFDPHPSKVLRPDKSPPTLQTLDQRLGLLEQTGVQVAAIVNFTPELAKMTPGFFVESVLVGQLGLRQVYVGTNFRFGHDRSGDVTVLRKFGRKHDYLVHGVAPMRRGERVVSSSRIRTLLADGAVEESARLLGRPHEIEGSVVPGAGRGSRQLVPTANVVTPNECLPGRGVYGAEARLRGELFRAAVFVGRRRTFGEDQDVLEAHLLDFPMEALYGEKIRLGFRFRVRGEQAFSGPEELLARIRLDIAAVKRRLARIRRS